MALLIVVVLSAGCARNVTPIVSYGEQMTVEITLRGNVDTAANRYFLILSSNPNYKAPLPQPNQIDAAPELIEPGSTPLIGSIEAYYAYFYNSWSDYVFVEPAGITLVKGPFVQSQNATREMIDSTSTSATKIRFTVRLGRMFDPVPDMLYFDCFSVPWTDGVAKVPADHLPSTNNSISKVSGSKTSVDEFEETSVNASLDILNCKVEIQ